MFIWLLGPFKKWCGHCIYNMLFMVCSHLKFELMVTRKYLANVPCWKMWLWSVYWSLAHSQCIAWCKGLGRQWVNFMSQYAGRSSFCDFVVSAISGISPSPGDSSGMSRGADPLVDMWSSLRDAGVSTTSGISPSPGSSSGTSHRGPLAAAQLCCHYCWGTGFAATSLAGAVIVLAAQ